MRALIRQDKGTTDIDDVYYRLFVSQKFPSKFRFNSNLDQINNSTTPKSQ